MANFSDYTPEQVEAIRGGWLQNQDNPQEVMRLMEQFGVSVDDIAAAMGGSPKGFENYFLQAGADPTFGGMSEDKPTSRDTSYIDWMLTQANPLGQGTLADVYKAQGIDPYTDPRVLTQAQEQNARLDSRNAMRTAAGASPIPAFTSNTPGGSGSSSAPRSPVVGGGSAPTYASSNFLQTTSPVVVGPGSGSGSNVQTIANVAPNSQGMLGAGNADYNSSLIRSLRQSSVTPFSNNAGVDFYANRGTESSNWTPPGGAGSAFNPPVFNQRQATPQEIEDWNAYNAYRASSVGASQPYMSMTDWINAGRPGAGGSSGSSSSGSGSGSSGGGTGGTGTPNEGP